MKLKDIRISKIFILGILVISIIALVVRLAFFEDQENSNMSNDKKNILELISNTSLNSGTYCDVLDDSLCATTDYELVNKYNVTNFVIEVVNDEYIYIMFLQMVKNTLLKTTNSLTNRKT